MIKFILLKSKYLIFDGGTILRYEGKKLSDLENEKLCMDYNANILESGISISLETVDKLKSIKKVERCIKISSFKITPTFERITETDHSMHFFKDKFITSIDITEFNYNEDEGEQLYSLRRHIYGFKIGTYEKEKYYFIHLSDYSFKYLKGVHPNCLFTFTNLISEYKGIIIDKKMVERVNHNLFFKTESPYIDQTCIYKREKCDCGKYKVGDLVKNKKIPKCSIIGKVIECLKINNQHCLLIKPDNKEENEEYIIHEEYTIKKVLKEITKYFEGIIIDPSSIRKMEDITYNSLEADDLVEVTLRESFQSIRLVVVWIGMVNDVKVAAVKKVDNSTDCLSDNLKFEGNFLEKQYFNESCFLVVLSSLRLISSEEMIIKKELDKINNFITNNQVNLINDRLVLFHKRVGSLTSISKNNLDQILKFSKNILKMSKKEILYDSSGKIEDDVMKYQEVVLRILRDLPYGKDDIVAKIISENPLMNILEHIYNCLDSSITTDSKLKEMLKNILLILWNIIKTNPNLPNVWQLKILTTFNRSNVDSDIKLLAALNYSLLAKEKSSEISKVAEYLKGILSERKETEESINDIYLGLGKTLDLLNLISIPEIISSKSSSFDIQESSEPSSAIEESIHGETHSNEDFLKIIKLLVKGYTVCEGNDELLKMIPGLKDEDIFCEFIEKQDSIPLDKYPYLFSKIKSDPNKAVLKKCTIGKDLYSELIIIAQMCLSYDKEVTELILNKMEAQPGGEFDQDFLDLAYASKSLTHDTIFNNALSKCTNINSNMKSKETFLTQMLKDDKVTEEEVKGIIEIFDINVPNKCREYPIKFTFQRGFNEVYNLMYKRLNPDLRKSITTLLK